MEITAQISALEEEIKILKGEIKSILTEIRTSVLTRDNPFAPDAGVPVFRPVELPIPGSQAAPAGGGGPGGVPTIAGLVAGADETASRLGPTHLHMVLELARFAGLIQQDAEEPLLKIIKLASSRKEGAAASVNDCLVALRQLEAIFAGSFADELALSVQSRGAWAARRGAGE